MRSGLNLLGDRLEAGRDQSLFHCIQSVRHALSHERQHLVHADAGGLLAGRKSYVDSPSSPIASGDRGEHSRTCGRIKATALEQVDLDRDALRDCSHDRALPRRNRTAMASSQHRGCTAGAVDT